MSQINFNEVTKGVLINAPIFTFIIILLDNYVTNISTYSYVFGLCMVLVAEIFSKNNRYENN